jgi:hypothetical protein
LPEPIVSSTGDGAIELEKRGSGGRVEQFAEVLVYLLHVAWLKAKQAERARRMRPRRDSDPRVWLSGRDRCRGRWRTLAAEKLGEVDEATAQLRSTRDLLQEALRCECGSVDECARLLSES